MDDMDSNIERHWSTSKYNRCEEPRTFWVLQGEEKNEKSWYSKVSTGNDIDH